MLGLQTQCIRIFPFWNWSSILHSKIFCNGKEFSYLNYTTYILTSYTLTASIITQMEMKLLLARLFQTYKISFPEDYKLVFILRGATQPKDLNCTLLPMDI